MDSTAAGPETLSFLQLRGVISSTALFRSRITTDTIFATCPDNGDTGMLGITVRKGQMLRVAINDATIVPYIVSTVQCGLWAVYALPFVTPDEWPFVSVRNAAMPYQGSSKITQARFAGSMLTSVSRPSSLRMQVGHATTCPCRTEAAIQKKSKKVGSR